MSKDNLFSIGEIAKATGVTRRIILNYEEKGLITPDKRNSATGNRYYTIDTFTQIRTIRIFQNLGLSLGEIREYFNGKSDLTAAVKRLENMRDELNLTIEKLKERDERSGDTVMEITIEPQTVYERVFKTVTVADKTNRLRDTALETMRKYGTDTTRRMYFTQYSSENPKEISYCVAIPHGSEGENVKRIPKLNALALFHHGAYEDISKVREKLIRYAKDNNTELSGIFRNLYLEGPPQHKDKSKFITQVIALKK